jgi:hypothetical protein
MITVKVTTKGLNEALRAARATKDKLEHRQEPLEKVKRQQILRWAQNFDSQGSIYGGWPALSERWIVPSRPRQAAPSNGPIFMRTGVMRAHFVQVNESGQVDDKGIFWDVRDGPDGWLATHQEGMDNPLPNRNPIPSRTLYDLDATDEDNASRILEEYVDQIVARYWS